MTDLTTPLELGTLLALIGVGIQFLATIFVLAFGAATIKSTVRHLTEAATELKVTLQDIQAEVTTLQRRVDVNSSRIGHLEG